MLKKLTKTEFAKRVGATQKSRVGSWVAINEEEKVAYFFGWSAAYDGKNRLHPMAVEGEEAKYFVRSEMEAAGGNGYKESLETIERVKEGEIELRLVPNKHKGELTTPLKFEYAPSFYMSGELHEQEDGLYFKVEGRTNI